MFKLDLEKAVEPEIKLTTSVGSSKKARQIKNNNNKTNKQTKNTYFCCIDYTKAFACVDHNNLENSGRDENTKPPDLPPKKSICRSKGKN